MLHENKTLKIWERLTRIKTRYDPASLFRLNQNIPPVPAGRWQQSERQPEETAKLPPVFLLSRRRKDRRHDRHIATKRLCKNFFAPSADLRPIAAVAFAALEQGAHHPAHKA